jgi:hypothetical protein
MVVLSSEALLDRLASKNPDVRRMRERWEADELVRTLALAGIRCLGPDEILARLPSILVDPNRNEILLRLAEVQLLPEQIEAVATIVRQLAAYGETVSSREKPRVDATIARIIKTLPQKTANELVTPFLEHRRRTRREIAYKTLRHVGVTKESVDSVIAAFRQTSDERMLELIARTADVVVEVDAEFLLQNLSEDYWRVRVLEAHLRKEPQRAVELSADYPREFIWAVGRAKAQAYLTLITEIADTHQRNVKLLTMYAWALGQLGAARELEKLTACVQQLWPDDQDPFLPSAAT